MKPRRTQFGKTTRSRHYPSSQPGSNASGGTPFGSSAADGFANGNRGELSGRNLEQNRAAGIDDPAGGSRQGRERNRQDPGEPT